MSYTRFAVYYLPPDGALAAFGARWLGWDVARGAATAHPELAGLAEVTATPRKYGFHGTLKPPFRLAEGRSFDDLAQAVARMAEALAPGRGDGLALRNLRGFLALVPTGDTAGIARVAGTCVTELDGFRAPPGAAELERRRRAGLSDRQEALLTRWGYPYVLEEFRFHLTLSGRLSPEEAARWLAIAEAQLPPLPTPFVLDSVALAGERQDGAFELIQRHALTG